MTNSGAGSGSLKGSGTVTGSGVDCGVDCFGAYADNTPVTLTAAAAVGTTFGGWTNCPGSTGSTCPLTMDSDKNVTATFNPNPPQTLTVNKVGAASGTVTALEQAVAFQEQERGIDCGTDCTEPYNRDTSVQLTAFPADASSRFTGWTDCDNPTANVCTMSMTSNKAVTATFEPVSRPLPIPPMQIPIPVPTPGPVTTTPGPPSTDLPGPPRLELGGASTQKLGSTIEVTAETDEPATLVADGTIASASPVAKLAAAQRKAKAFPLPAVRADAPARTRVTLKLPVARKAVAAIKASLKRGRRATASVKVVATDPGGDQRTVLRTIRIKR